MHFRQALLEISLPPAGSGAGAAVKTYALLPGQTNSFDPVFADFQREADGAGERFHLFLHPKQDIVVQRLELQFSLPLPSGARFFANGFQSWSESRRLDVDAAIPKLRPLARRLMGLYGDTHIPGIPHGPGVMHSWTYTYLMTDDLTIFGGSLNETTGFTLFIYDHINSLLTVRKDLGGLHLSHSFPALDVWLGEGREVALFDAYFALRAKHRDTPAYAAGPPRLGWTSWYNHFTRISEDLLLKNLENVAASGLPFDFFQIDDGWQTAVGDWLSVKPAFPKGMGWLAGRIRERGLQAGLWLAPFVASAKSALAQHHPDWLLKGPSGKPLRAGWNPAWGGWYHALDFYHPRVQEYLSGVFHTVFDQWGFELLKLDFLFAVCLAPPPGKTRGQVMHEAMTFIRRQAGGRSILGCGVPLAAAFDLVEYCRIGGDIHLSWEHRLLRWLRHRERVDTLASLRSTLGRWQLNGRAFGNDPDVFMLRDNNQNMTAAQQQTILLINALLGNVLFTSDDVGAYSPEQRADLEEALRWRGSQVRRVLEPLPGLYCIEFSQGEALYAAYCNLTNREQRLEASGNGLELLPFESFVLSAGR